MLTYKIRPLSVPWRQLGCRQSEATLASGQPVQMEGGEQGWWSSEAVARVCSSQVGQLLCHAVYCVISIWMSTNPY